LTLEVLGTIGNYLLFDTVQQCRRVE